MGDRQQWLLSPTCQLAVKAAAGSDRLTSDGGAILLREAAHRLGLSESLAGRLVAIGRLAALARIPPKMLEPLSRRCYHQRADQDSKVEGDEIVNLVLVADPAYSLNSTLNSDHLTITDNDYWDWDRTLNPGDDYRILEDESPVGGYSTGRLDVNGWATARYNADNVVTVNIAIDADFTYQGYFGWPYHREQSDGGKVEITFDEHGNIDRWTYAFSNAPKQDEELKIGVSYVADIQDSSDSLRWVRVTPQASWAVDGTIGFTARSPEILGAHLSWSHSSGGYSDGVTVPTYSFYLKVFENPD